MSNFNELPKTIKKTVRYIYQEAPLEKLVDIQKVINDAIVKRKMESNG